MLDSWQSLSPWIRYPISLGAIGLVVVLFFGGALTYKGFALGLAAGVVLLCFSGRSQSETKGYRF